MTELDQFLTGTEQEGEERKVDLMDQPLNPEQGEAQSPEESDTSPRNRRERRLMAKLEAERESSIKLAETLSKVTEAQRFTQENEGEYLKAVERIYGNQTPEAAAATDLLKSALKGVYEAARKDAAEDVRGDYAKEAAQLKQEESRLDEMADDIEDTYNVDLNDATRKSFYTVLERMSPKDKDGNILEFADHHAVWEVLQSRVKNRTENRSKDLSSRSMSQAGGGTNPSNNAAESFLRDNGII